MKFSDLLNVFELFIFSDIFEANRQILNEGNSLMLTLIKNYNDENSLLKRINVKKIISLKDVLNKPFKNITFKFDYMEDLERLKKLSLKDGETEIKIELHKKEEILTFFLKDKRNLNNKLLNTLNLTKNVVID